MAPGLIEGIRHVAGVVPVIAVLGTVGPVELDVVASTDVDGAAGTMTGCGIGREGAVVVGLGAATGADTGLSSGTGGCCAEAPGANWPMPRDLCLFTAHE